MKQLTEVSTFTTTITVPEVSDPRDPTVLEAAFQGLANRTKYLYDSGGGGAPSGAQYVTLATNSGLSAERVLAVSARLTLTDAGANGTITIDINDTGVSAGTYANPTVTVNDQGQITDITEGASAPGNAQYVCVSANGTLTDERVLAVTGTELTLADGGAGNNITLGLYNAAANVGTFTLATVTVDQKGRVTAASNGSATLALMVEPGGRLTASATQPVPTSDISSSDTLYYLPLVHNNVSIYTGSTWQTLTFTSLSLSLTSLTRDKLYDIFVFKNGSNELELEASAAWTDNTTRSDALARQDGRLVKSSDHTRLWLGTIRVGSESDGFRLRDSVAYRAGVCNAYNQRQRSIYVVDTADSWNLADSAAWRQANANTANQVWILSAYDDQIADLGVLGFVRTIIEG